MPTPDEYARISQYLKEVSNTFGSDRMVVFTAYMMSPGGRSHVAALFADDISAAFSQEEGEPRLLSMRRCIKASEDFLAVVPYAERFESVYFRLRAELYKWIQEYLALTIDASDSKVTPWWRRLD